LYGAGIKAGATSNILYNHYSILRTIEDAFGLGTMADQDEVATPIKEIWQ
jgi:hypothetical protein